MGSSLPFGVAGVEASGGEAPFDQEAHRVVRVDAVGAAAVGDDLAAAGELIEGLTERVDGDGAGTGDVARVVLEAGSHVDDDGAAPVEAIGELVDRDLLDLVAGAEVGVDEDIDVGDMGGGDVTQRRPQLSDSVTGEPVDDPLAVTTGLQEPGGGQRAEVVGGVGHALVDLEGDFLDALSREAFHTAHDVSAYSFPALAKAARPMMQGRNGALLTLSYLGAVRAVPNYNVMGLAKASLEAAVRFMAASLGRDGIRVNGISAGPIKTLAAAGISGFSQLLKMAANQNCLRRNVTIEEVGNTAAFLLSDLSSGITGEITYVDAGFSVNSLNVPE